MKQVQSTRRASTKHKMSKYKAQQKQIKQELNKQKKKGKLTLPGLRSCSNSPTPLLRMPACARSRRLFYACRPGLATRLALTSWSGWRWPGLGQAGCWLGPLGLGLAATKKNLKKCNFFLLTGDTLIFFWVSKGHTCKNFGCPRGHPT